MAARSLLMALIGQFVPLFTFDEGTDSYCITRTRLNEVMQRLVMVVPAVLFAVFLVRCGAWFWRALLVCVISYALVVLTPEEWMRGAQQAMRMEL